MRDARADSHDAFIGAELVLCSCSGIPVSGESDVRKCKMSTKKYNSLHYNTTDIKIK